MLIGSYLYLFDTNLQVVGIGFFYPCGGFNTLMLASGVLIDKWIYVEKMKNIASMLNE